MRCILVWLLPLLITAVPTKLATIPEHDTLPDGFYDIKPTAANSRSRLLPPHEPREMLKANYESLCFSRVPGHGQQYIQLTDHDEGMLENTMMETYSCLQCVNDMEQCFVGTIPCCIFGTQLPARRRGTFPCLDLRDQHCTLRTISNTSNCCILAIGPIMCVYGCSA